MRQFECPSCGWSGHPSFELNGKGKLVAACQGKDCSYQDASLGPADFTQVQVVPAGNAAGNTRDATVVDPAPRPRPAPQPVNSLSAPTQVVTRQPLPEPLDIIASIKTRRDWLEAEIARLEGYRIEKRKLDKMLAAARRVEAQQQAASLALPATRESN